MLFLPTKYLIVKAALLVVVLGLMALKIVPVRRVFIRRPILIWCLVFILAGFIFTLWGITNGSIFALKSGKVDVLWPMIFSLLLLGNLAEQEMRTFLKIIIGASVAIGLYTVISALAIKGFLPHGIIKIFDLGQRIEVGSAFPKYYSDQLPVLGFTVPFLVTLYKYKQDIILRRWILASLAISMIPVLASGRNALWLITALSPFIALILLKFAGGDPEAYHKLHLKWKVLASLYLIAAYNVLQSVFSFDLSKMVDKFTQGFAFSTDPSAMLRREQFYSLLNGWLESPLLGNGLGTSASMIRSDVTPWIYELTYVNRLFHTGILGAVIYVSLYLWIFYTGLRIARQNPSSGVLIIPLLAGLAGMLIANATNPYIAAFDYMWITFLPLAFINGLMPKE